MLNISFLLFVLLFTERLNNLNNKIYDSSIINKDNMRKIKMINIFNKY